MSEQWRAISGTDGRYEVSDQGRVRSIARPRARGRILKPTSDPRGYQRITIHSTGSKRQVSVHRLVCLAFLGDPPDDASEVRHLNGDPRDNRLTNLAWGSRSENARDKIEHGTNPQLLRSQCPSGHPYDEANTRIYKGERRCRACSSAYMARLVPCRICGKELRPTSRARHERNMHAALADAPAEQRRAHVGHDGHLHLGKGADCVECTEQRAEAGS
jgi:hypothetical protein